MARHATAARRYAEAAFQIASRDGTVDEWLQELDITAAALGDESTVRGLEDPAVPFERREKALVDALGSNVSVPVRNLLVLLLHRHRMELVPQVAAEFRRLYNRLHGITVAAATTAAPLEPDEVDALGRRLSEMTGGLIELTLAVDPSLLGGIVVRLGDRLIDGSVRGRLEQLRSRLAAGTI